MSETMDLIRADSLAPIEMAEARAHEYIANSVSEATKKARRVDWGQFEGWCTANGRQPMPATPETVVLWLSAIAERYKPGSLDRKLASVSKAHQAAGYDSPTRAPVVRTTLRGIRRTKREAGQPVAATKKAPILAKHLRAMVDAMPDTVQGKRDRAILLLGYAGGFRRSELSNLDVADLEFRPEGLLVTLRHSKTNQDGAELEQKDIGMGTREQTCPVRAVRAWLQELCIDSGPVFRPLTKHMTARKGQLSGHAIARIVKRAAKLIGIDADEIGAHSLRAGFVTDQFERGTPTPHIMHVTGHRCERVLNGYCRRAKLFERNLSAIAGL